MSQLPRRPEVDRRSVLRGIAVGGVSLPLLTACGAVATDSYSAPPAPGPGTHLAKTTEVPVGGGKIVPAARVVVTQPKPGRFKGFSAVCTHQGCLLSQITDGAIVCPCHYSEFSVKDGSVLTGPASSPLPAVKVTVKGKEITVA